MRIIVVSFSTCLAASVGTVPVTSAEQVINTDHSPLLPASHQPAHQVGHSPPENTDIVSPESEVPHTKREPSSTEVTYGQQDLRSGARLQGINRSMTLINR